MAGWKFPARWMPSSEAGATPVPLLATMAMASGTVERKSFDILMNEIEERLKARAPVDGVFLALHGAMIMEDEPDAEAEIVRRVRAIVARHTHHRVAGPAWPHHQRHAPARCRLYRLSRISPYRHV